jgi:undecaprenyl-diphosphatase
LHNAIYFASAPLLAIWATWILKVYINVPRPLIERINESGPSFPSAHTAAAAAYFFAILHFAKHDENKPRRILHYIFCILASVFVGVSRLYLGVHWLSDVVVGYAIGVLSVYVCFHVYNFYRKL